MSKISYHFFLPSAIFLVQVLLFTTTNALPGQWQLLQPSIGISAMHMQLLPNDRVIIFDRTNFGPSNLSLPEGRCRNNPDDLVLKNDCTAHSAEYDVSSNSFRPLNVFTDTWCSSGALLPNGSLAQSGGFRDGDRIVRIMDPCKDTSCDWSELGKVLLVTRWYASNHLLPNGQMIIVGGTRQFNYEFYPKTDSTNTLQDLPFLSETNDARIENNLYPYVFLNVDGNLFIFANNRAILLNYVDNTVVRTYPTIPDEEPRSYPSTGSAVLLPLKNLDSGFVEAEFLVCGGAPKGSYQKSLRGIAFETALDTCARMKITDIEPQWIMEKMPMPRTMGDMLLLPTGRVLIVNGASSGTAGWEQGRNATRNPVVYDPEAPIGSRFEVQTESKIPRVYHSTAVLLRDGRVMVGGSNPHGGYNFTNVLFPTDLSLEAFSPSYLDTSKTDIRPVIISPAPQSKLSYGIPVAIQFLVKGAIDRSNVKVTMIAPPFNTHSFSQGQRMLFLTQVGDVGEESPGKFQVVVSAPSDKNIAVPGFYMLFVVHRDIPSVGIWVQME